jgi:hypothetical protein
MDADLAAGGRGRLHGRLDVDGALVCDDDRGVGVGVGDAGHQLVERRVHGLLLGEGLAGGQDHPSTPGADQHQGVTRVVPEQERQHRHQLGGLGQTDRRGCGHGCAFRWRGWVARIRA